MFISKKKKKTITHAAPQTFHTSAIANMTSGASRMILAFTGLTENVTAPATDCPEPSPAATGT